MVGIGEAFGAVNFFDCMAGGIGGALGVVTFLDCAAGGIGGAFLTAVWRKSILLELIYPFSEEVHCKKCEVKMENAIFRSSSQCENCENSTLKTNTKIKTF